MMIRTAQRLYPIKPSPTLSIAAKAALLKEQGKNIINLGVGEPDFDTPEYIKAAAIDAIHRGYTKYTPVEGIKALRLAVIEKFKTENELLFDLPQILISVGGKQSCYNLCQALINPGDEVIIPAPYWVSYPDMVALAGGLPVVIPTTFESRYKITPDQLEAAITDRTRLFFINSPSNPSGIAYSFEELQALGAVLLKYPQVVVATDDMYEHILWSQPFCNILNACPELSDRTMVLNGISKAYAMTGWRIGYAAGPVELIRAMGTIQSQSTSNPCSIAQYAALAALTDQTGQKIRSDMKEAFHLRHNYLWTELSKVNDLRIVPADGTFYSFPDLSKLIERLGYANDLEFSEALLTQEGLALVPGSAFGSEGNIRLSFATNLETLKDAVGRLIRFIQ